MKKGLKKTQPPSRVKSKPQHKADSMLKEADVIKAARYYLQEQGYEYVSHTVGRVHGIDLVMIKNNKRLCLEAKGQTSSIPGTSRHGKPFSAAQVRDHVSTALYKGCQILSQDSKTEMVLAFPETKSYRNFVGQISKILDHLSIKVYWVKKSGTRIKLITI